MEYWIVAPRSDTSTNVVKLTAEAFTAWETLMDQGEDPAQSLREVISVFPRCSLSIKKKSMPEFKKEVFETYANISEPMGSLGDAGFVA